MLPVASICMSAHNKPQLLPATLDSIYKQAPPFDFETIVIDDGSKDNQVRDICRKYPVRYHRINRPPVFRNPCAARNAAYRMARGEVIIAQSDEVIHATFDAIERLVTELRPGTFVLANVFHLAKNGTICGLITGPGSTRPLFFLGSLYRADLYAVGGNDEEFLVAPACEDSWFGQCLIYGRRLRPVYSTTIVGYHQWHTYTSSPSKEKPSMALLRKKHLAATRGEIPWYSTGGPWPFEREGEYMDTQEVFTKIHRQRAFYDPSSGGLDESVSGAGSSRPATKAICKALPGLIEEFGIKTFVDIGCGDCNWVTHVDLNVDVYKGLDIVPDLIEANIRRYGRPGREFLHADLLTSDLPQAELVLCRDVFVHLSNEDSDKALANLRRSGSTYLLATTFTRRTENADIKTGEWTPYNMQAPPFNWPEPIRLIDEKCREHYPNFSDKHLGLWKLADLEPKGVRQCE